MQFLRSKLPLLIILALFANAVFASTASAHPMPSSKELSSLFGDKVLICTADGYKWMTWDQIAKEQSQPTKKHNSCKECCNSFNAKPYSPPQYQSRLNPFKGIISIDYQFRSENLYNSSNYNRLKTRSPPSFA